MAKEAAGSLGEGDTVSLTGEVVLMSVIHGSFGKPESRR